MTVASLIDADDRAMGGEVIPLRCKAVIKEQHPAMQKQQRWPVAEGLRIQLGAVDLVEALHSAGTVGGRS